jgi:hypothetical protein
MAMAADSGGQGEAQRREWGYTSFATTKEYEQWLNNEVLSELERWMI